METFSALLAICAGNSPVPGEFPAQRPVTRSFDVFFDLRLNKRLSKQSRGWWFETLPRPLWRHSNVLINRHVVTTPWNYPTAQITNTPGSMSNRHRYDTFMWVRCLIDVSHKWLCFLLSIVQSKQCYTHCGGFVFVINSSLSPVDLPVSFRVTSLAPRLSQ